MEKVLLYNKYNSYMKKRVIAYLQTHWDREWYREKEEFNLRLLEVFDEVLDELENDRAPSFYFDGQTSAILDYLKFREEKLPLIEKLIKEKRLFVGPFFVSADAFMVNLRCFIKNLEIGLKHSLKLGCSDFTGYLPDIFGHSRGVFDVLDKFNIKNAIIWRGADTNSEIKVRKINTIRLTEGYFIDILHQDKNIKELALDLEKFLDNLEKKSSDVIYLPLGGDHLAVIKNSKEKIKEINKYLKKYEIELKNPFEFFKSANFEGVQELNGDLLDNSSNNILGGVYSARIPQKIQNTKLMHKISRIIEPLNVFLGLNYAPNIDFAYQTLVKNHAHDSICGCSTDKVSKNVDMRFEKVDEILSGLEKRIVRDFHKNTKKPCYIGIFNMSDFKGSKVARIISEHKFKNAQIISKHKGFSDSKLYNINQVPITEDILTLWEQLVEVDEQKALSFGCFEPKKAVCATCVKENSIENKNLKLTVKDGKIEVLDKKTSKVYKDFLKITDTKDSGDSYNYAPNSLPEIIKPYKTKIVEMGDIQSTLRIYYKNLELDVILNNYSEFFEFRAKIKNKKKNHKLQAVFCLDEPIFETYAQDSLGIVKRKCDPNYSLYENQPAKRPYELKTNSYPMMNFVFAQNTGVLTEGLNEYEIYKNELRIALLRSVGIISNPKCPSRSIPAGPPLLCDEMQYLKDITVRFGVGFLKDKIDLFRLQDEFLNTKITFALDKKINNITFYNKEKNQAFYGITSNSEAILYNLDKDELVFKKLDLQRS